MNNTNIQFQPTYDLDMTLLGYYEVNDMSGGQNFRLDVENGKLVDRREVRKYYKKQNGKYLTAFKPVY